MLNKGRYIFYSFMLYVVTFTTFFNFSIHLDFSTIDMNPIFLRVTFRYL